MDTPENILKMLAGALVKFYREPVKFYNEPNVMRIVKRVGVCCRCATHTGVKYYHIEDLLYVAESDTMS
jgi:hypothetical protein